MLEGAKSGEEHKSFFVPLVLLNCGPFFFFFHDCAELQAHFEATEETEEMNEDPDEVDQDGPPADPPGSEAHAIHGGTKPTSALVQEAQYQDLQQNLSLQLDSLRQETGRSVRVEQ